MNYRRFINLILMLFSILKASAYAQTHAAKIPEQSPAAAAERNVDARTAACIGQKVDFSGSKTLDYRRVISNNAARLYIQRKPTIGCRSSGECAGPAYLSNGDIVATGKECSGWSYVQYIAARSVYYGWVPTDALRTLPEADSGHTDPPSNGVENPSQKYSFHLMQGRGKPVCEAYLQRLNSTVSHVPPYCDRPESDVTPGFSRLKRVVLSANEYNRLAPLVSLFTHTIPLEAPLSLEEGQVDTGAWLYSPLIDIENDGKPREILLWQGFGASDYTGECGDIGFYGLTGFIGLRQAQIAYVLKSDRSEIDDEETRRVFGRPPTAYQVANPSQTPWSFRPVGRSIGIFKYRDAYYFDTFFDGTGDFHDQRMEDPRISNTLGVFENRNGKTQQVCELQMDGNDFDNSFFRRLPQ